ncbi:MAG: hypothetical protein AAF656_00300 [Planctomycetota bacterium]
MRYFPELLVLSVSILATSLAMPGIAGAEPGNDTQSTTDAANEQQAFVGDPYPLSTDPVSGKDLTDEAITHVHEQRQLRFNGEDTMKIFLQDPAKHLAEVDEKLVAMQRPYYPLTTCPVSGGELGSMGEPVDIVVGNRLVRLCCAGCEKQVRENPEPIIPKLDAAVIEQQSDDYALETCPVSSGKLGSMGEPVNYVIANRLVKLCCAGCVGAVEANPAAVLDKLDGEDSKTDDDHAGHDH